jgi:hypothetical protein
VIKRLGARSCVSNPDGISHQRFVPVASVIPALSVTIERAESGRGVQAPKGVVKESLKTSRGVLVAGG